jgi:ATP-dependent RNA helicase SUPV3L1/SUV3
MNETMLLAPTRSARCSTACCPTSTSWPRPRFSKLSYVGPKKATRLPARSAVVGFSANEVYAIAELIPPPARRHGDRDGRAQPAHAQRPGRDVPVGRGRLPGRDRRDRHGPQHGREPRLVRVVRKYDGRQLAALRDVEIAQIAGRAGVT